MPFGGSANGFCRTVLHARSEWQFAKITPAQRLPGKTVWLGYAKNANEFRHIARVDFWLDVEQGVTS